ncbi:hypothetical protein ASF03_22035 [Rhizobium sp. Leaf68]|nr:hypothetical protein ASE62_22055 [Rhizobium sp. Leaf202]KQN86278.1 hypothetical protein ASF03_22035 [Rhizobium sp. Leaf68]
MNLAGRPTARDKFPKNREEKRFTEPSHRRIWLEIEGMPNNVTIILIQNDPEPYICIKTSTVLFDRRDFTSKTVSFRMLRRNRKEKN